MHSHLELVAPAGNPARLETALRFGADAVYLGLKKFSMRAFAGNFSEDELAWAIDTAHEQGRKVYVTLNVLPFEAEADELDAVLRRMEQLRPDGLVLGDLGLFEAARKEAPHVPAHVSTQLSVTTSRTANAWFDRGAGRIVLARELSLENVRRIAASSRGPLEVFIHGAVCIAYSGRCLLSLYWAQRDPRRGACAQGCRWAYKAIEDGRRPGLSNPVEQDERGTYFFDANDLCALPLLPDLLETGVQALKIEGRTRSEHYLAVVTDVYRHAIDRLRAGDVEGFAADRERYLAELARPVYRGFSTHFLGGEQNHLESYNPDGSPLTHRNHFLGKITSPSETALDVAVRYPFAPGDAAELVAPGLTRIPVTIPQPVSPTTGHPLAQLHPNQTVRLPGLPSVPAGSLLRVGAKSPKKS